MSRHLWTCPECDRVVNGLVNGTKCPDCGTRRGSDAAAFSFAGPP